MKTAAVSLAGLLASAAHGAPQPVSPHVVPPANPAHSQSAPLDPLPPSLRLGLRAEAVQRQLPVISVVVIVPDTASYITAIGRWNLRARFPVLIDDGSPTATEDIARFVRAFAPERVCRWSGTEPGGPKGAAVRDAVELAVAHAWEPDADEPDEAAVVRRRWKALGLTPAGVVVADTGDPAWTAALALSAGRGQPIAWVDAPAGVNRAMKPEDAASLAAAIEGACAGWEYSWANLGDDLDAVTLCLNTPVKIEDGDKNWISTTDRVGRHPLAQRWAWAGQVFGDAPRAAYNAMCALFLRTNASWHFESYPGSPPWSDYSQAPAAGVFREAGMDAVLLGGPAPGADEWRLASSRALNAGLVCVNSKGTRDFFDLAGSRCQPGAIPFLGRPAMVYFVHSWSANAPANRATVGGRWMERGAYGYLGSVQEPMLTAFVPTPTFAARMAAGGAWGAVVRMDSAPVWKLAVIGDPLATLGTAMGPWPPRTGEPLPLVDAADLAADAVEQEKNGHFPAAVRTLVMLGQDQEAALLAGRVLIDETEKFDADLAAAAIMPLFRTGRTAHLLRAFAGLDAQRRADGVMRDALWNAWGPELATTTDAAAVTILSENLREDQLGRDAVDLAGAIDRTRGSGAGRAFLASVRQRAIDPRDQADLDKALDIPDFKPRAPRSGPGRRK